MAFANITRYGKDANGQYATDEFGEPKVGWYYQMMEDEDTPIGEEFGPYPSEREASEKCLEAWNNDED